MLDLSSGLFEHSYWWVVGNFFIFLTAFATALYFNFNFNMVLVGFIYLAPLVPIGFDTENAGRFLIVSAQNTLFGILELVIFALTVKGGDAAFDKKHIQQLVGHTLPIALALIGLSFVARASTAPVTYQELALIAVLFLTGSVLRGLAVYQIGKSAFKFDIVFRQEQRLKEDQLYSLCRHPSYSAMMVVIFAYAVATHSWLAGTLGLLSAWFGFQYRIYHEEVALKEQFGEQYERYRSRTGMWLPRLFHSGSGSIN